MLALRNEVSKIQEDARLFNKETLVYIAFTSRMAGVLKVDVAGTQPIQSTADYGIDSLVAVQPRDWMRSAISVSLAVNDLMASTVGELVNQIIAEIKANHASQRMEFNHDWIGLCGMRIHGFASNSLVCSVRTGHAMTVVKRVTVFHIVFLLYE